MKNSIIVGTGHYVPQKVVTNADLEKLMDTSDEWIQERTGIKERRWVSEGETQSFMAEKATRMALDDAGMQPEDIEFIVFAGIASEYMFPGGACFLGERLGLPGVPALDIRQACSGFVYALSIADKFIKTGTYKNVLVICSEIQSTSINKSTEGRDISVIFADGAGAAMLTATDDNSKGVLTTHLHADGSHKEKLVVRKPSINDPQRISANTPNDPDVYPYMDGRFVFKHAIVNFSRVIGEALAATGNQVSDINLLIPHQANKRISEMVGKKLGLSEEQVFHNIQKYGNTTAASIPIGLSEAMREGRIKKGDLVCMAAFGAGFTWGSVLVRF
ncbi:MAG: 3-oxoacyl-ACP synthase III family protein [Calditrichia bacterium]